MIGAARAPPASTGRLLVMQSSGGISRRRRRPRTRPPRSSSAGPAAGVIGARHLGAPAGYRNIITLDMGGTTAKASLIEDGQPRLRRRVRGRRRHLGAQPAGRRRRLRAEAARHRHLRGRRRRRQHRLARQGGRAQGRPARAPAPIPGPACYGRGGKEPTVTDANVVLGYLNPTALAGGTVPIDAEAARRAVAEQIADAARPRPRSRPPTASTSSPTPT